MNGAAGASTSAFVERWPELFEGLSERQVAATVRALVDGRGRGFDPVWEEAKALTDVHRGVLTQEGYLEWAADRARALAGSGPE